MQSPTARVSTVASEVYTGPVPAVVESHSMNED